jgi:hypothetical protein
MGGYNTLIEVLSQERPVLAFPHDAPRNQAFQARKMTDIRGHGDKRYSLCFLLVADGPLARLAQDCEAPPYAFEKSTTRVR